MNESVGFRVLGFRNESDSENASLGFGVYGLGLRVGAQAETRGLEGGGGCMHCIKNGRQQDVDKHKQQCV